MLAFGAPILVGQLGEIAIFQSSSLLIANRLGPEQVPRYTVPYAMFLAAAQVCHAIYSPYWPAFTEAAARGDWCWIRARVSRILRINLAITILACAGMIAAGRRVIHLWAGPSAVPEQSLLVSMSVYFALLAPASVTGMLMWALGLVGRQSVLTLGVGVCQIGGFLLLVPRFGLPALPLAGAAGLFASAALSCVFALRHMQSLSGANRSVRGNSPPAPEPTG